MESEIKLGSKTNWTSIYVNASFARQLETELQEARENLKKSQDFREQLRKKFNHISDINAELISALASAKDIIKELSPLTPEPSRKEEV